MSDAGVTMEAPTAWAHQDVATGLMGPPVMGWVVQLFFCGLVIQSFTSYRGGSRYKAESVGMKALAWTAVLLCIGSTLLSYAFAIHTVTMQTRDVTAALLTYVPGCVQPMLAGCIGLLAQCVLTERSANTFPNRRSVLVFKAALYTGAIGAWVASIATTAVFICATAGIPFAPPDQQFFIANVVAATWLMLSAAIDIVLTITMFVCLHRTTALFGNKESSKLGRWVTTLVQTAAYTTVFGIAGSITAVCFPSTEAKNLNVFLAFIYPLPSFYCLSILINLASREPNLERYTQNLSQMSRVQWRK